MTTENTTQPQPEQIPTHAAKRYASVDVLRGFDMFWLVGGAGFFLGIGRVLGPNVYKFIDTQLDHSDWVGCTWYDTIFPLFLFIVGMSVVFSLNKFKEQKQTGAAYKRMIRRFVLLFALGVIYYGGFAKPWPDVRVLGVLQRIGLCYLAAGMLFYHFKPRTILVVCISLLVFYWALFSFVPVPGTGKISFVRASNWDQWIDQHYLPGWKHDGTWDDNGILSTLPCIANTLMGVFAALFIRNQSISDRKKVAWLILGGLALAGCGWLWGLQFPVVKRIVTSSYVVVTGGYSYALLGLFYLVIDVWGWRWGTKPFLWIGANPITIYVARKLIDFNGIANRFVGGSIHNAVGDHWGYFLQMTVSLALSLLVVRFMYKKKIFLRV